MFVCNNCSMRISDSKLLSFASGEIPIPGDSLRSLGHNAGLPVLLPRLHSLISVPPPPLT